MNDPARTSEQPQRRIIGTRGEYVAAFEELAAGARRELRVFDPDGAQLELNAPAHAELLRRFLNASRDNRLWIAVHDPEPLRTQCPRLTTLLAEFSASIAIHQTEGEALRAQDCFVIADKDRFVRRPVATAMRGIYALGDLQEAHMIRERFEEVWQNSFVAISPTTLGL